MVEHIFDVVSKMEKRLIEWRDHPRLREVRNTVGKWFTSAVAHLPAVDGTRPIRGGVVMVIVFLVLVLLSARSYSRAPTVVNAMDVTSYAIFGIESVESGELKASDGKVTFMTAILKSGTYSVSDVHTWKIDVDITRRGHGIDFNSLLFDKLMATRLLTCDRATGIIYTLEERSPVLLPVLILTQPFTCEWMTRDQTSVIVGGSGSLALRIPEGLDHRPTSLDWETVRNIVMAQVAGALPEPQCVLYSALRLGWVVVPNVAGRGSEAVVVIIGGTATVMALKWPKDAEGRFLTDCKFVPDGLETSIIAYRHEKMKNLGSSITVITLQDGVVLAGPVVAPSVRLGGIEVRPHEMK